MASCLEMGEASVETQDYEKALSQYEHGLRVVPTHTALSAGKLATQRCGHDHSLQVRLRNA